jgi:hypothetical protein
MWSLMRGAEVELWVYLTEENEENRAIAEKAFSETLEFIEYV